MNPLGMILLLSHPRALTQPSCNGAGRRNEARGSFEGRFWGSSVASAATSRTRRGYGLLPSASCAEAAALEKVGSGGFFSQGEFCCSFARGEGVLLPKSLYLAGRDSRRWLCPGRCGSHVARWAGCGLGFGFVPVQPSCVPGFCSSSPAPRGFDAGCELGGPRAIPTPESPALPGAKQSQRDQAVFDGIREGFTQTGLSSLLTARRESAKAQQGPSWDPPGHPAHKSTSKTSISGTSWAIFQWEQPPSSLFTWETIQAPLACGSPSCPPPSIPPVVSTWSRCQDSSTAPLSGSGFSCCHPRGALDTQQKWQSQRDPGGGEETNNGRNQPPPKNTMSFFVMCFAGRIKPIAPAAGLRLGSVTRPPLRRNAATQGFPGKGGCSCLGEGIAKPFEPPPHQKWVLVAPFWLHHLETQPLGGFETRQELGKGQRIKGRVGGCRRNLNKIGTIQSG